MVGRHISRAWLGLLPLLCMPLVIAASSKALADESTTKLSSTEIEHSVISSLPNLQGKVANVVANLDLTKSFQTRTQWTFVAAVLPGSHFDGADAGPVDGGALATCFADNLVPHCTYGSPKSDSDWFSTPIEFYSA